MMPLAGLRFAFLMTAALVLADATAASGKADDAEPTLSAPQIRVDLAKHFHCQWRITVDRNFGERSGYCLSQDKSGLDLFLSADEHDRFSYVEYQLMTRGEAKTAEARAKGEADRDGANWLLNYFLPRWREGPHWLSEALDKTIRMDDFHERTVGSLGVAVAQRSPADRDETIALLGITLGDPSQWAPPGWAPTPSPAPPSPPAGRP